MNASSEGELRSFYDCLKKAQADDIYLQGAAVDADEVRKRLSTDPESPYQELKLDETPAPQLPAPPMPGEGPPGARPPGVRNETEGQESPTGEDLDRLMAIEGQESPTGEDLDRLMAA